MVNDIKNIRTCHPVDIENPLVKSMLEYMSERGHETKKGKKMKIYCCQANCPNKIDGYAICTALMDVKDCPKRKNEEGESNEENSKTDCDLSL